jgi:hypothetical protein
LVIWWNESEKNWTAETGMAKSVVHFTLQRTTLLFQKETTTTTSAAAAAAADHGRK